jgi:hypothetical protein
MKDEMVMPPDSYPEENTPQGSAASWDKLAQCSTVQSEHSREEVGDNKVAAQILAQNYLTFETDAIKKVTSVMINALLSTCTEKNLSEIQDDIDFSGFDEILKSSCDRLHDTLYNNTRKAAVEFISKYNGIDLKN